MMTHKKKLQLWRDIWEVYLASWLEFDEAFGALLFVLRRYGFSQAGIKTDVKSQSHIPNGEV